MTNFSDILVNYLRKADRVAALTGAGVSRESRLRIFLDDQPVALKACR